MEIGRIGKAFLLAPARRILGILDQLRWRYGGWIDVAGYLDPSTQLDFPKGPPPPTPCLVIGRDASVGPGCVLAADSSSRILIREHASLNSHAILIGNIVIGRYCILAPNIYMSSGNHQAFIRPEWTIRDQDALGANDSELAAAQDAPIALDEDVWVGFGVFVKRGVRIGRGAVIGANAVVTKDVPPYTVQAGVPNKTIGERLRFVPPEQLDATRDESLPYFYQGFFVRQNELRSSRAHSVVWALAEASLVMAHERPTKLELRMRSVPGASPTRVQVSLWGHALGTVALGSGAAAATFEISPSILANARAAAPPLLHGFLGVQLRASGVGGLTESRAHFGLELARLF
jgi:acetyltransferase-like isoleucine patch superfamily enzyme